MKQRQRSGLVTPQMGNANALPLTSPQPVGQAMQHQQSQPMGNNSNLTPSHHHRTLSQSSNVQPQMQQGGQQQQSQQGKEGNANLASSFHGITEENLLKATHAIIGKLNSGSVCLAVKSSWRSHG